MNSLHFAPKELVSLYDAARAFFQGQSSSRGILRTLRFPVERADQEVHKRFQTASMWERDVGEGSRGSLRGSASFLRRGTRAKCLPSLKLHLSEQARNSRRAL